MLPQNLKVNSPIVLTKLVSPRTLAILIDKQNHLLLRMLDCTTQTPIKTYKKKFSNLQESQYYIVDNFLASYDAKKEEIEIMELSSAKLYSTSTQRYHKDISVTSLHLSENGMYCITGDANGKINIWNPKNHEPEYTFSEYESCVVTLNIDKNNLKLISGRADGSVILYRLDQEQNPMLLMKHENEIKKIFFIDELIVSVDSGGRVNIYDLVTHSIIKSTEFKAGVKDMTLAYNSCSVIIRTSDNKILLVNLDTIDKEALEIDETTFDANSMAFDDVSQRLILSTNNGDLLFYDLDKEQNVLSYIKVAYSQSVQTAIEQESAQEVPKKKFTFLSVDDSKSIRNVIVKAIHIGFPGTEVLEAVDGAEALNMIHEHDIDCVILDWNMPKLNGEEVLKYIRVFHKFDKIKIIMATTEAERTKVLNAIKSGADGYIVKPFNPETFFSKVSKFIMLESEMQTEAMS